MTGDPGRVLPDWLVERARAWSRAPGTPVPPRRAATVVILRPSPTGTEVYLLRRAMTMAFAAAMYAFPGGAAEPEDADIAATAIREVFEETGVRLREIHPWSRWITPEFEPRRYDAYFFVSQLPEGEVPQYVEGGEADRVLWIRPADAVRDHREGIFAMLPPTMETLREISTYADIPSIIAASTERDFKAPIVPKALITREGARMVLPGEDGY